MAPDTAPPPRPDTALEKARVGDVDIAYRLDGPAAAPVVMMGHCFCADHHFWDPHLPALAGFRALRFDVRGHGQSGRPAGPYRLAQLAADAAALIDHLGLRQVHYVGVSMGGMIGQTLALNHADRLASLSLVNTTARYSDAQRKMWRQRADDVLRDGIAPIHADLMRRWFTDQAAVSQPPGYRYIAQVVREFDRRSFAAMTTALCELDTVDRLPEISVPTLVVAAPEDPGVPPEMSALLAAKIPAANLHWLSPARHLATLEHVGRFNHILAQHLAAVA